MWPRLSKASHMFLIYKKLFKVSCVSVTPSRDEFTNRSFVCWKKNSILAV